MNQRTNSSVSNATIKLLTVLLLPGVSNVLAEVHYVDASSTNATPPYTNWATAATNIQDAVDAAVAGDEVLVTNGTYYCSGLGPVRVDRPLTVRSANGPGATIITASGSGTGCVYLTNGACLSGFSLTNGSAAKGGAVFCESQTAVVSNCVVSGNRNFAKGDAEGGGAYGGTLNNCIITGNSAAGGGLFGGSGGGAAHCTLNNCTLTGNLVEHGSISGGFGGGAASCTLNNCTLIGNSAAGGGASGSTLNNCTLTGNAGGGAVLSTLNNCIVFFNEAPNYGSCNLNYCCTTPLPTDGLGNITNAPLFVDTNGWANLHLQSNSPCINAGNNVYGVGSSDLDGNLRIVGGTVDIGAYEFQSPVSKISYAWLQQYGLSINASTDTADPDGDAVDNYHEWLAGTNPTNSLSSPAKLTIMASGTNVLLSWSTNAVGFTLQSATNLPPSAGWQTNSTAPIVIGDQNVITNPASGPRQFFRLGQ